jgi:uncharacterized protein involved in exopolysaccharide biosynthesis
MITNPPTIEPPAERQARGEAALWRTVGILASKWKLIAGVTTAAAVAAVVISLLMPNWYRASARLLLPEGGSGLNAALLRNLPPAATALLGGGGRGDYMRYQSILTSRSVMTAAVDSFDLTRLYELEDALAPLEATIDELRYNTEFEIDLEFQFLEVAAYDRDPERAAALANFFVRKLNEVNSRLAAQNASNYRGYIERRYLESLAAMDSLMNRGVRFQKEYGIYDLPAQTASFFQQVGDLRAQALAAEIQHEVARSRLGPDNTEVQTLAELARAANGKYRDALEGSEKLLPVAQSEVPDVARTYAELELQRTIQVAILEILGPMYEQARLQEEQKTEAVQVVDYAVPPTLKARPKRSVIVILSTISVFLLSVVFVLLRHWLVRNGRGLFARLDAAMRSVSSSAPSTGPDEEHRPPVRG